MCQSFFFDKVAGLRPATLLKKRLWQSCFLWICEIFKNTFFYRTPPVAASENVQLYWQTLEECFSQSSPWINLIASKSVFYFSYISGEMKEIFQIVTSLGYGNATLFECKAIQEICKIVSLRAAKLAAAGLTTIIRVGMKRPV